MEEEDRALEVFVHVQSVAQGKIDIERREHADGDLCAFGGGSHFVVDAAAGACDGESRARIFSSTLAQVAILDVRPQFCDGFHGCLGNGVHRLSSCGASIAPFAGSNDT